MINNTQNEVITVHGGFELHKFKSLHKELVSVVHKDSNMCVDISENISPERIISAIKILKKFDAYLNNDCQQAPEPLRAP
jgi:hypothetical protein